MAITKAKFLKGEITVPGDKSISHRGVMFGAISEGITELNGFLNGADCRSTIDCFRKMGIDITQNEDHVIVHGKGLHGLSKPSEMLDVGNSGTTTRLISGILCGQNFISQLNGDASIQKRPMNRIITPLTEMGANIKSLSNNSCAPLEMGNSKLHSINYTSPVASAQVKSCILLAGLYADGITSVTEPVLSRNHTELMLSGFGAKISSKGLTTSIECNPTLVGQQIEVPGDISSAAYFIVAGLICNNSDILIKNVNTNPTRAGIIKVAQDMGGNIELLNERIVSGEPVADIHVKSSNLHACEVSGDLIPTLIDEIPVIAVMAACASGTTVIKDAAELKVKESDRIATVTENLTAMGASVTPTDDGMIIEGGNILHGAHIKTYLDHRIAMSFAIAGLAAEGETSFDDGGKYKLYYDTVAATGWKIMIAIPQSELNAPVNSMLKKLIAVSVIAIILCALIVVIQVSGIAKNIRRVSGFAQSLASGDFTIDSLRVRSRDELGQMGSALNNMYGSNKNVITNISDHANSLTSSSQKLNFAAENLNREFADIHHHIADVNQATLTSSAATEELNASAENVKAAVVDMTNATADSIRLVDDIKVRAKDVEQSSESAYKYAAELAGKFRVQLTHSIENARVVDEVSRMASAISAIASQINLLSLNASVEAARAGEHGKGFAVVASEVGNLASQTSQTVRDIEETIEKVQAAFDSLSKDSQDLLTFLTDTVAPDYQKFVGIGQQYQSDAVTMESFSSDIAQKSREIEHVIKEMVLALQDIAESSGNTAASSSMMMNAVDSVVGVVDEVSTMSGEQNKIASNLNSVVNQFKL